MDNSRQKTLLRDRGICVVIPTYNNVGTIATVVNRTLVQCGDVIVVNDGSTDGTAELLRQTKGITLIEHTANQGKGQALKTAFSYARQRGFAFAITLDADGQHYPEDIPLFLKANQDHPGALVVGSRKMEGVERSKGSDFANKFSNFWFWVQTGRRLPDTQTGYRLYPLKKLRGLSLLTSRYEAELELMVMAAWHGVELVTVDVNVYYPPKEQRVSHFRPGKDFLRISLLNTLLCFLAVVYGLPLRLWRTLTKYFRTCFSLLFFVFFSLAVVTPVAWLYVKLGPMTERKRLGLHKGIQWLSQFIMQRCGIPGTRFSSRVADATVFQRPHVIICNHQSHLDLMCQLVFSPKMVFLTKDWVWNNPFYGFLIRHAEFYPVREGVDALMPKLRSLVDRGYSIAVYPEGTRSETCSIGRFHQGAFHLSEQLGIDLLPMYLYGPGKVLPKKARTLRKGPIYIEVGNAVTRQELQQMGGTLAQAAALRRHYKEKYEAIANRIEQDV